MRNNKSFLNRILIILFGIVLISICLLMLSNTLIQEKVLNKGVIKHVLASEISSKRSIKSIYVKIDGQEYFAGEAFGKYRKLKIGDSINVHYLEGEKYVVLEGKKSFRNSKITELFFVVVGICLIFFGFVYREKKGK